MLNDLLQSLTSHGAVAIKNVQVFGISGTLAIPDGAALPPRFPKPFFIEMKTGFDAEFTPNQREVYRMICLGGHAVSFDPRIRELGLVPGAPLPPMNIMIAHTYGPGLPITFDDYCRDFLK